MAKVWLNSEFLDDAQAALGVAERGFLLGEAAFETMRWSEGAIRRWPRHHARLAAGLGFLNLPSPSLDEIEAAAAALAQDQKLSEGVLRLTVGGGETGEGMVQDPQACPTLLLTLRPRPAPPASLRLAVLDGARRGGLPAERFKLAGYAGNLAARRQAKAQGADMAVLRGSDGQAPACADSANLFWVDDTDRVITPPIRSGALPGTTRAALMEAAAAAGLHIEEACEEACSIERAAAVCVTNAVIGVVPAASLQGRRLAVDHPVLQALMMLEREAV